MNAMLLISIWQPKDLLLVAIREMNTNSVLAVASNALRGLIATTLGAPNDFASSLCIGEIDLSLVIA
jgi:hypothetical protein